VRAHAEQHSYCRVVRDGAECRRSYSGEMTDLVAAVRTVVLPAVEAVFREGEVGAIDLRSSGGSLHISITVGDETFHDQVIQADVHGQSSADWRERLRSNLVDFVAESRFGWGQNRGQAR
jgi:hypothetical protein